MITTFYGSHNANKQTSMIFQLLLFVHTTNRTSVIMLIGFMDLITWIIISKYYPISLLFLQYIDLNNQTWQSNRLFWFKVLSLLEPCFDFISSKPLLLWKFKSWAGKILKIWSQIFKFSIKSGISMFLTIFRCLVLQIRYQ